VRQAGPIISKAIERTQLSVGGTWEVWKNVSHCPIPLCLEDISNLCTAEYKKPSSLASREPIRWALCGTASVFLWKTSCCLSVKVSRVWVWKFSSFLKFVYLFVFETGSHYVTQASLALEVLLPQPPKC
jgi:hypothetical protein